MGIEFIPVGGYNEVGRNMAALKIDEEVIILDMGLYMPKIVDFEEEGNNRRTASRDELIAIDAIPNDHVLDSWRDKVKAIVISHCHLDHIGAAPFLAPGYNAPIIGTPYTLEVLKSILKDDQFQLRNPLKQVNPNSSIQVSRNIKVELINMTHSTLQTALIAVHTKYGTILYANDFKFDKNPVLGKPYNIERLHELGKEGKVLATITDSLYSATPGKCPSENVAREMLKDVMLGIENQGDAMIVTTFASNLARIKSILDFSEKLGRKPVILGRSLLRYITAADNINLTDFTKRAEVIGFGQKIKKRLRKIEKEGKDDYIMITTGSQGEPNSVLSKMTSNIFPFNFGKHDHIIFSCKTIPVEPNIANRKKLEDKLRKKSVRIFTDIHTSGHMYREDIHDFIQILKPEMIFPAQSNHEKQLPLLEIASELGYKPGKDVRTIRNGEKVRII
ncbi:MAG: MBL fold metallo-hydrolase [Parcubacteria group bacterium]|nr:MBL fold metallo-hydrolase [Parcubacteria group bacterium]